MLAAILQDATPPPEPEVQKKRGLSGNRTAGHGYELLVRDIFRNIGFAFVTTCRSESRTRDNQKIDLINEDEATNGRFPYNVQCKSVTGHVPYHNIFHGYYQTVEIKRGPDKGTKVRKWIEGMSKTPGVINVILHKFTEPEQEVAKTGDKIVEAFKAKGYYAIIDKRDFLMIVAERLELQQLREENKKLRKTIEILDKLQTK